AALSGGCGGGSLLRRGDGGAAARGLLAAVPLWLPPPAVPAIGIRGQPFPRPAAEKLVNGLTGCLANQVPARQLNGADGGENGRAALVLIADQVAGESLHLEWVHSDDTVFDPVLDQYLDRPLLPLERCLAEPGQSRIGGETHEQVIPQPGVGQERFEPGNLHRGEANRWAESGKVKSGEHSAPIGRVTTSISRMKPSI